MWIKSLLNLVFPPRCEVCRKIGEQALCPECFQQIKFMKPQFNVHSVAVYDGVLREALHRLKFKKKKSLVEPLGILLVKYVTSMPSLNLREIDYLVPVPLHWKRERERGFNQVELIAKVLSRYFEIPVINALQRIKETQPQFDLPREERLRNVVGAFKISDPKLVYNKRILLLDDIYTTGATVAECCRVLKIGGARRVEILTLARAMEMC